MTLRAAGAFLRAALRRDSPYWRELFAELGLAPALLRRVALPYLRTLLLENPSLLSFVERNAKLAPDALALELDSERLSWRELWQLSNRVALLLRAAGVQRGDVVALCGHNSPRYVGMILGAARLGATTALINYNLVGTPLGHSLSSSRARLLLVEESLVAAVQAVAPAGTQLLPYGSPRSLFEQQLEATGSATLAPVAVDRDDDFVFIYTSGTTGLPKPCRVSHARALLVGGLSGCALFDFRSDEPGRRDKLYTPLPLYHSSALLIGVGAAIVHRVPTALRASFSASHFLSDVRRYDATAVLYIGELCRYLLLTPPSPADRQHRLRVAVGNGLRPEIWASFRDRFAIPQIREFYAATEAPGGLVNLSGVEGSIGKLPGNGLGMYRLVRFDVEREEHLRDRHGFCIPCELDEPGELLIEPIDSRLLSGLAYRGYTDAAASEAKLLHDVFRRGDRYFRTGDLMRRDALGFYYFVDRIGDTFRCKGENVSTAEVASILSRALSVGEVAVLGLRLPGVDGQLGLAAVVPKGPFNAAALFRVAQELPSYAQPRFVRLLASLAVTSTHKHQKARLRDEGVDPQKLNDPLFVRTEQGYIPLTAEHYAAILDGSARL